MSVRISIFEEDNKFNELLIKHLALQPQFKIISNNENYKDVHQLLSLSIPPDVVLIGLNSIQQLHDAIYLSFETLNQTHARVIILSSLKDEDAILKSFNAGAVNYILKDNLETIVSAIYAACGEFDPLRILLNQYWKLKEEQILLRLSKSELEIFELMMKGYTQTQIQQQLVKSIHTVKNQIGQILKKLNATSSKEAIKKFKCYRIFDSGKINHLLYFALLYFPAFQLFGLAVVE